jgi:hypothetical protein
MRNGFMKGVLAGSLIAAIVTFTATAFAGTGLGAVFNLGRTNSCDRTSTLTGTTSGKVLQVTNAGLGPALGLTTDPETPPLRVSSRWKVANLNTDMVDGQHGPFVRGQGTVFTVTKTVPYSSHLALYQIPGIMTIAYFGDLYHASFNCVPDASPVYDVSYYFDSLGGDEVIVTGVNDSHRIFWADPGSTGYAYVMLVRKAHTVSFSIAYKLTSTTCTVHIQGLYN